MSKRKLKLVKAADGLQPENVELTFNRPLSGLEKRGIAQVVTKFLEQQ